LKNLPIKKRFQNRTRWIICHRQIFTAGILLSIVSGCHPPQIDPNSRNAGGPPQPIYAKTTADAQPAAQVNTPAPRSTNKAKKLQIRPDVAEDGGTLGDILLTPLRTYRKVQVRIDEIQIKSQLNSFRASKLRNPKDFKEYKKEILDPVGITLPDLPDGDSYVYQPDEGQYGELMVRSKKK